METKTLRNISVGVLGLAFLIAVVLRGFNPAVVVGVELLLVCSLFLVLWHSYYDGLRIQLTPIAIMLTLMWVWMGISAAISPSSYLSLYGFFLLSSSIFVFWILSLMPQPVFESFWSIWRILLIALGMILAIYAFIQIPLIEYVIYPKTFFVQKNSFGAFMSLLALPLAAYYLTFSPGWRKNILAVILFVLFFAICITNSYGVALGFSLGFVCILWFTRNDCAKKDREMLLLLVLSGLLLDRLFVAQSLLLTPLGIHTTGRLVIWAATWHLLQHSSWYGSGIYNFFLYYTSYMPINDGSAGQYVHNDYLQFWVELGYPGLLLVIGLVGAVFYSFITWLKAKEVPARYRLEGVGLFAGILAIATHSFVTYNFYILPSVMLFGIVLARFDYIVILADVRGFVLRPTKIMSAKGFRLILVSIFTAVGLWLSLMICSQLYYQHGRSLLAKGKLILAEKALNNAAKLYDTCQIEYSRAQLYAVILNGARTLPRVDRQKLYMLASGDIKRAAQLNPLRSIAAARAALIKAAPDIVGGNWLQLAIINYQLALKKNPRLIQVRMDYIKLLLLNHRYQLAGKVLNGGIIYSFHQKKLRNFYMHALKVLHEKYHVAI
ncbi:MAG: O-antigen ligase family protein [Gammaproteobacteria bacterium]|nr:O-antigen ligase family protein [Gammaproteobacteria bacterium]